MYIVHLKFIWRYFINSLWIFFKKAHLFDKLCTNFYIDWRAVTQHRPSFFWISRHTVDLIRQSLKQFWTPYWYTCIFNQKYSHLLQYTLLFSLSFLTKPKRVWTWRKLVLSCFGKRKRSKNERLLLYDLLSGHPIFLRFTFLNVLLSLVEFLIYFLFQNFHLNCIA